MKYKSKFIIIETVDKQFRIKILKKFLFFAYYVHYTAYDHYSKKHIPKNFNTLENAKNEMKWLLERLEEAKEKKARKERIVYMSDEN